MKELEEKLFEEKIIGRLDFLARAYMTLHNEMIRKRLPEEDFLLDRIGNLLSKMNATANKFSEDTEKREELKLPADFVELIGTMKFIAKRVHEIEKRLEKLENHDINHQIKITIDSEEADKFSRRNKNFDPYCEFLLSIPQKEAMIISHHFGLYGNKKTKNEIAHLLGVSPSMVDVIIRKSIIRVRRLSKFKFDDLPEGNLKKILIRDKMRGWS
jgi:DNA-directed RNA polymerase specialized sigma subunit